MPTSGEDIYQQKQYCVSEFQDGSSTTKEAFNKKLAEYATRKEQRVRIPSQAINPKIL